MARLKGGKYLIDISSVNLSAPNPADLTEKTKKQLLEICKVCCSYSGVMGDHNEFKECSLKISNSAFPSDSVIPAQISVIDEQITCQISALYYFDVTQVIGIDIYIDVEGNISIVCNGMDFSSLEV